MKELILRIYEFIQSDPFPDKWLQNAVESYNIRYEEKSNIDDIKLEQTLLKDEANLQKSSETKIVADFSKTDWGKVIVDNAVFFILKDFILLFPRIRIRLRQRWSVHIQTPDLSCRFP